MPAAAPVVALGLTKSQLVVAGIAIASTAVTAFGQIQAGKAARQNAEFTAAIERQRADRERLNAKSREEDFRRRQSGLAASRRALLGGSGTDPAAGSPLLVAEDIAGETELQALRIRNGGEVAATRLEQGALLTATTGRQLESAGRVRAGASLLAGIGAAGARVR